MDCLLNSMLKASPNYSQVNQQSNQLPIITQNQNIVENKLLSAFYQKKPIQQQPAPVPELQTSKQQNNMFLTSYLLLQNLAQQNKTNNNEGNNISQMMMQQFQDQAKINFANSFLQNLLSQTQNKQQTEENQLSQQNQQNYQNFKKLQIQWQQQFLQTKEAQQSNQTPIQNQLNPQTKQAQSILIQKPQQIAIPQVYTKEILEAKSKKIKKQNTKCGHLDREHYAKGMCNPCYHRFGRSKRPTECPHENAKLYAHGLCQNCYINNYNKIKREGLAKSIQETVKQEPDQSDVIQQQN